MHLANPYTDNELLMGYIHALFDKLLLEISNLWELFT